MGGIIVKVQSEKNDSKPNTQIHHERVSEICERHVSSGAGAGAGAGAGSGAGAGAGAAFAAFAADIRDVDLQECKKKIENDAHDKLMNLYKEDPPFEKGAGMLIEIMSSGAREFKQKTGREMTYAEMRDMYG